MTLNIQSKERAFFCWCQMCKTRNYTKWTLTAFHYQPVGLGKLRSMLECIQTLKIRAKKVFEKSLISLFGPKAKSVTSVSLVMYVCQIYSLIPAAWEATHLFYPTSSHHERNHIPIFTCFSSAIWHLLHKGKKKRSLSPLQQHSIDVKFSSIKKQTNKTKKKTHHLFSGQ